MPVTGNNPSLYELSIRIFADGFSFLVTQASSGDLMHREDIRDVEGDKASKALHEMLGSQQIKRYIYNKVRAIVETPSTTVPSAMLESNKAEELYLAVYPKADLLNNYLLCVKSTELEATELFTLSKSVQQVLLEAYPDIQITCPQVCLFNNIILLNKQQQHTKADSLFAHIQDKRLYVISLHEGKLRFSNTFPADNIMNALFFMLSVWKELQMDAKQNTCYISGTKQLATQLSEKASQYIIHVERVELCE